jgi:hypothetical protein
MTSLKRRIADLENRTAAAKRDPRLTMAFVNDAGEPVAVQVDWGPLTADREALALPIPTDGSCKVMVGVSPLDL